MLNMDLETSINSIPYLEFMQQQAEQQEKLNVRSQDHLEREQSTTEPKKDYA